MTSGILKNPGLKLLAFIIAVSLWVLVAGEEEAVRVFTVPIDYTLSKDLVLASETPGSVQVRLRGSDAVLRRLTADDLSVPVDLTPLPVGRRSLQAFTRRKVRGVPSGAAIEAITPESMSILIERKASRTVVVSPRFEGTPPAGYRLVDARVEPERITLEGPEKELARVLMIPTEPIPLQARRLSFSTTAQISLEEPRLSVAGPRSVQVTVHIEEDDTKK